MVLSLKLARARLSFVLRLKGRGERINFSLPFPPPRFCPNAHPKGCNFYTRLSSVVVKSKIATAALQVEATFAHLKIFLRTKHFCASGFSKAWDKGWLLNKVNSPLNEVFFFKNWLSSAQGELPWVIGTEFSNFQYKTQYIRYYYYSIILVVLIPNALKRQATDVKKVKLREEAMTKCSHLHSLDIVSDSICSVGFFPTKRKSWLEKRNKRENA